MKKAFRNIVVASFMAVSAQASSAQEMPPCAPYDQVMDIFEQQGTEYRGVTEGPNHRLVNIYENVATGRGIALFHDTHNNELCPVSFGFNYADFALRVGL